MQETTTMIKKCTQQLKLADNLLNGTSDSIDYYIQDTLSKLNNIPTVNKRIDDNKLKITKLYNDFNNIKNKLNDSIIELTGDLEQKLSISINTIDKDIIDKNINKPISKSIKFDKRGNPSIKMSNELKNTKLKNNTIIYTNNLHFQPLSKHDKFTVRDDNNIKEVKLVELEIPDYILGKEFLFKDDNPFQHYWSFYSKEDEEFNQYCIVPSKTHFGKLMPALDSNGNNLKWESVESGLMTITPIENANWVSITKFSSYKARYKNYKFFEDNEIKFVGIYKDDFYYPYYLQKGDQRYYIGSDYALYIVSDRELIQGEFNNKKQTWRGDPCYKSC